MINLLYSKLVQNNNTLNRKKKVQNNMPGLTLSVPVDKDTFVFSSTITAKKLSFSGKDKPEITEEKLGKAREFIGANLDTVAPSNSKEVNLLRGPFLLDPDKQVIMYGNLMIFLKILL